MVAETDDETVLHFFLLLLLTRVAHGGGWWRDSTLPCPEAERYSFPCVSTVIKGLYGVNGL